MESQAGQEINLLQVQFQRIHTREGNSTNPFEIFKKDFSSEALLAQLSNETSRTKGTEAEAVSTTNKIKEMVEFFRKKREEFFRWYSRLSPEDKERVDQKLTQAFDSTPNDIFFGTIVGIWSLFPNSQIKPKVLSDFLDGKIPIMNPNDPNKVEKIPIAMPKLRNKIETFLKGVARKEIVLSSPEEGPIADLVNKTIQKRALFALVGRRRFKNTDPHEQYKSIRALIGENFHLLPPSYIDFLLSKGITQEEEKHLKSAAVQQRLNGYHGEELTLRRFRDIGIKVLTPFEALAQQLENT